jgi:hypothetical protein
MSLEVSEDEEEKLTSLTAGVELQPGACIQIRVFTSVGRRDEGILLNIRRRNHACDINVKVKKFDRFY